jgi:carbon storage regulator
MLVIRRREGETVVVDGVVEVTVLEITPTRVKLGIEAPARVVISRKEVVLTVEQNRLAAVFEGGALESAASWLPGGEG